MRSVAYLSGAARVTTDPRSGAGGPRAHVTGVVDALRHAGCWVDTYIAGDEPWAKRLAGGSREATVRKAPWRAVAADGLRLAARGANRWAAPRRIDGAVDVAYERFGSFQALGQPFQRRGATWVLETSGPFFHEARAERGTLALTSLARRTEMGAYARCDLLVCVSDALRAWLVDAGVDDARTYVMPNAVDTHRFDPASIGPVARGAELVVGFVGTVLEWQGLATLIDAVARARAVGAPVRAVIVGDGPALGDLRRAAVATGVDDVVTFTGQVPADEIPGRIAQFDLGVSAHLPRLDGAMYHSPLKLYEYLAMGVPLLAADHPEARGLVEASGAGFLFPAGDAGALADVLVRAAGEVEALRGRADHLRAFVVAHHSWDERVASLLSELERRGL